ncbi:MAG TPA: ATP-binding cassette domain-containing protein, partial [Rubricoccaceae bacterium]
ESGAAETVAVADLVGPDGRVPVLTLTDAARASLGDPKGVHTGHAGPHGEEHDGHKASLRDALRQVRRMLRPERRDLWTIGAYALAVGLTSLVLPLVSQALIDAISLGVYTSQVLVLGGVIALGMLLNSGFSVVQHFAVDLLQRRIFVRTELGIARGLPRIRHGAFNDTYAPELVNRFFDVVTFQKALAKLLMDGLAYTLVAVASLALLAVYSPFFLVISVVVVLFVPLVVFGLGHGGLATSVHESEEKYALARWLEEVGRAQTSFKLYAPPFVHARADAIAARYVGRRGEHFRVLVRQDVASLVFRTVVTLAALGIGGGLVVQGQLSLGQFVAAELALLSLLTALDRLVGMLEHGFDLLTAAIKIAALTELPTDVPGADALGGSGPLAVGLRGVSFAYAGAPDGPLRATSLDVPAGARVAIVGENGAGRTTLAYLLAGILRPTRGLITLGGTTSGASTRTRSAGTSASRWRPTSSSTGPSRRTSRWAAR